MGPARSRRRCECRAERAAAGDAAARPPPPLVFNAACFDPRDSTARLPTVSEGPLRLVHCASRLRAAAPLPLSAPVPPSLPLPLRRRRSAAMGGGWRRFWERMHQGAPVRGRHAMPPTSNARCTHGLSEAATFTAQLKHCERAITSMAAANAGAVRVAAPKPMARKGWRGVKGLVAGGRSRGGAGGTRDSAARDAAAAACPLNSLPASSLPFGLFPAARWAASSK